MIEKQLIRNILEDQKSFRLALKVTEREINEQIRPILQTDQIIILSGARRTGKSTLLQKIRNKQPQSDYFINFDDERLNQFRVNDFQKLYEVFIELFGEQQHFYFDEIQNIPEWERFVRRLHDYKNKIVITGSNAAMLSKELGTRLTGRYHQLSIYPFSFREYLSYHHINYSEIESTKSRANVQSYFYKYLKEGGFPGYLENLQPDYLKDLYTSIIYRDVITRHNLSKINELKTMVYFIASNIGKIVSYGKLKQLLNLGSSSTVAQYFEYLSESYLTFVLTKFDYSVKRQALAPKKIYMIDTAMAQIIGFRFSEDIGRILENIVYLEFLRKQQEVYYHADKKECDFILFSEGRITAAYQVTMSLSDEKTKQRELAGLIEAMLTYDLPKGIILTQDEENEFEIVHDNKRFKINVLPVWKWLVMN